MFDMSKFCFSLRGKRSEIQADLDQMPTVAPVSDRISRSRRTEPAGAGARPVKHRAQLKVICKDQRIEMD